MRRRAASLALTFQVLAAAAAAGSSGDGRLEALRAAAPDLDPRVLELALTAHRSAAREGLLARPGVLAVIDYSLPSTEPRLWVLDLESPKLLFRELVAHGVGTGENRSRRFSNRKGSKQSSLGLFATGETYRGRNGYSLRLHGLEKGVNDLAFDRAIVMHGAWYVSEAFARDHGRLGRSWGCPAVRDGISRELIDRIRGGSALFAFFPDQDWLASSRFLSSSIASGASP
ncbi:MAG: murein L,D-transpeptidase catalytic domain family protein [Acidobacteria bacterium]|nr:murein L,D-transpeptidase catalytic domain family protein [Acidobacteriota bacterium]MCB9377804.1 murein L,D-transpeptidase catalytic domain family protein [Holophagales bacterium]